MNEDDCFLLLILAIAQGYIALLFVGLFRAQRRALERNEDTYLYGNRYRPPWNRLVLRLKMLMCIVAGISMSMHAVRRGSRAIKGLVSGADSSTEPTNLRARPRVHVPPRR